MKAKDQFKYTYNPHRREELLIFLRYVVKPIAVVGLFLVWLLVLAILFDVSWNSF